MTTINDLAHALSFSFGPFRPSDRSHLLKKLAEPNGEVVFLRALEKFVESWATADWIEEYSVERVGMWMAVNLSPSMQNKALALAHTKRSGEGKFRTKAYDALCQGISKIGSSKTEMLDQLGLMQT